MVAERIERARTMDFSRSVNGVLGSFVEERHERSVRDSRHVRYGQWIPILTYVRTSNHVY